MDFQFSSSEQAFIEEARAFCLREVAPFAREADEQQRFPEHIIGALGAAGYLQGPLAWAGSGPRAMDHLGYALLCSLLGQYDTSVRGFLTVQSSLVIRTLALAGNEAQRQKYLPSLSTGALIGCFALTEPEVGSDMAGIQTEARRDGQGNILLNGHKIWITNGLNAGLAIVFANLEPGSRKRGLTAFLVETDRPGFHRSKMPGEPLGHRASDHAHIHLEHCLIPETAQLGEVGSGYSIAHASLLHGRLGVASGALGIAQAAFQHALDYTKRRQQFGRRIADFQMIQGTLAELATRIKAAEYLVYAAARAFDRGESVEQAVSMAKFYATELACQAASEAVLLLGNRGYSSEYPVERLYRDCKGLQIYEGTSHIQRLIIGKALIDGDQR